MPRGLQVSESLGVGSWSHCFTVHEVHLAPVFGLAGNTVQEGTGAVEQNELEILPTMAAPAAMP